MKSINYKFYLIKGLLIIIFTLYFSFLYVEFSNIEVNIKLYMVKYICIILCFLICLLTEKNPFDSLDSFLLKTGLFITMFADLFLTVFNYYVLGVILFSLVQIIYSIRYEIMKSSKTFLIIITIFLLLIFTYLTIHLFTTKIDVLFIAVLFYSICIIISLIKAIKAYKSNLYPYPNKHMIVCGMVLFLLCDINVALHNVTEVMLLSGNLIDTLHNISAILIWLFYIPSQVLLSLSGYNYYSK